MKQKITAENLLPENIKSDIITKIPLATITPETIKQIPIDKRNLIVSLQDVYSLLDKNPSILEKILSDRPATLLLFLWMDLSKTSEIEYIRNLPIKMFKGITMQNLLTNLWTSADMAQINNTANKLFGPSLNYQGDILLTKDIQQDKKITKNVKTVGDVFDEKRLVLSHIINSKLNLK